MYKIMIVEDDPIIADGLATFLKKWAYEPYIVSDFNRVLEDYNTLNPHMVLLDITLPFFSGYYWCTEIRKLGNTPVIFISSTSDNMSMVMAINMGADDFIPKPFDLEVVLAKVQALLRRTYSWTTQNDYIAHNEVVLNLKTTDLSYKNQQIALTKNEFRILQTLMEDPGRVVTREVIMERLWESESFIDDNTLTVNINRLRKKLDNIGLSPYVLTKKGIGYQVAP